MIILSSLISVGAVSAPLERALGLTLCSL